jgi:hypothetical protein
MSQLRWNTEVNAPCIGEIVDESKDGKNTRGRLIQTDFDYPSTARLFGWSMREVQKCSQCDTVYTGIEDEADEFCCDGCDAEEDQSGNMLHECCDHRSTDGTVNCRDCSVTAIEFIDAAGNWLREHDGAVAEEPD